MIIKKIAILGTVLGVVMLATACGDKLTKEEEAKLEILVVEAEKYYEEKYDVKIQIGDYGYETYDQLFGFTYDTSHAYFHTSDGYNVNWTKDEGFADDAQAEAINEAIKELTVENYSGDGYTTYFAGEIKLGDDDFTEYFDGDIVKYLLEEEMWFYTSGEDDIIYVSGDVENLIEDINKYFREHNNYEINIVEESYLGQIVNYGEDGCIAQYDVLGSKIRIYEQHYIEIAEGVYATAMQDGIVLEDGDIKLAQRGITKEEMLKRIQTIYDEATEEHRKNGGYFPYKKQVTDINIEGKFLQIEISDNLKEQIEAKESGNTWIDVVIKLDDAVMEKGGLSSIEFDWVVSHGTPSKKVYKSWFKIDEENMYYFIGDFDIKEID